MDSGNRRAFSYRAADIAAVKELLRSYTIRSPRGESLVGCAGAGLIGIGVIRSRGRRVPGVVGGVARDQPVRPLEHGHRLRAGVLAFFCAVAIGLLLARARFENLR